MKIKLATLFSGIGAVEQAFVRLNIPHQIVFACDNGDVDINVNIDKEKRIIDRPKTTIEKKNYVDNLYKNSTRKENYVKKSYLANYKVNENDFYNDIRLFDARQYKGKVDLLVGGSPCQSFSSVGFRGGLDDARGTLFYDYARIIKEVQPRVFIYENVRGLTTHDGGRTWIKIKEIFDNTLKYKISEPQILNAADFGIPQTRRRLFVIGIRKDIKCKDFEYPIGVGIKNLPFYLQDILEENCAYNEKKYNFTYNKKGEIVIKKQKGYPNTKFTLTPRVRDYVIKPGTKGFKTSVQTDLPIARTLLKTMTQHHRAGVDNYITIGNEKNGKPILRSLTDRESLRLMGYPDNFKIVVSSTQIFKQAGNSIVVDVMMAIIKKILETGCFK